MKESLLVIPEEFLKVIQEKQDKILSLLEKKSDPSIENFITEKDAMKLLKRHSTWFWQMRKCGALPYSKIGKAIYYSLSDLQRLVEISKINGHVLNKNS